jgi:hypothetical protein
MPRRKGVAVAYFKALLVMNGMRPAGNYSLSTVGPWDRIGTLKLAKGQSTIAYVVAKCINL